MTLNWHKKDLDERSIGDRVADLVASMVGSWFFVVLHIVWFSVWIMLPVEPFPYGFLTMAVSLEAIFLALFVLSSQNRLAMQADKRAHLDLQIDLLAEREMTAVLRLLQDIATQMGVPHTAETPRVEELAQETDVHELTSKLDDELPSREGT